MGVLRFTTGRERLKIRLNTYSQTARVLAVGVEIPSTPRRRHGCCNAIDNQSQLLQMVLMIICVCRGLNTSKVTAAIEAGARSPAQVHAHHDTTINCGKCCETVCGMIHSIPEAELGPWVRAQPGEDPYPVTMNRAAVAEIERLGPEVVLAKGDLT